MEKEWNNEHGMNRRRFLRQAVLAGYILCGFDNREGGRLGTGSNEYIRETVYWSCRYGCCS